MSDVRDQPSFEARILCREALFELVVGQFPLFCTAEITSDNFAYHLRRERPCLTLGFA